MVFDAARGELLLFGGRDANGRRNDLWRFDGGGWTQIVTSHAPPPRSEALVTFDVARGNVVLFGGDGTTSAFGDTWVWNGTTWAQR